MSSFASLRANRDRRHAPQSRFNQAVEPVSPETPLTTDTILGQPPTNANSVGPDPTSSRSAEPSKGRGPNSISQIVYNGKTSTCEVLETVDRGRGLFTPGGCKAGTVLLKQPPLQAVPSTAHLSDVCSGCLLTAREIEISNGRWRDLTPCSGCGIVVYCSVGCKDLDQLDHEAECRIFQAAGAEAGPFKRSARLQWMPSEAVRALGRICLARKRDRQSDGKDPEWWGAVKRMENHLVALSQTNDLAKISGLAHDLDRYLRFTVDPGTSREDMFRSFGFEESTDLLALCSALQVNSFTLSLPSVTPIGVAISPRLALANHSCEPNAVVVFPEGGRKMRLVAIRDLKPGEEILTAYIDVSMPYAKRQAELSATYRFTCQCERCTIDKRCREDGYSGTEIDIRATIIHRDCQLKERGSASLPLAWETSSPLLLCCGACKERFKFDPGPIAEAYANGVIMVEADAKGQEVQSSSVRPIVTRLSAVMPPTSYPLLQLLRIQTLEQPTSPGQARHLANLYSVICKASADVYPTNHPVLAILHAEWGQILAMSFEGEAPKDVFARLASSVPILRGAFDLCGKAFGPGGGIEGKKVADTLREIEFELDVARGQRF